MYKKGQRGAIEEDKRACCPTAWMGEMLQVSAHEAHSRHSLPSLSLHHGNIHHTLFTPLYEAGKHGNQRGKVYVSVCVCVLKKGVGGMQICSCCQLSNKDLHKPPKKVLIAFSRLGPLEQSCLCGYRSSLSAFIGSRSGGH